MNQSTNINNHKNILNSLRHIAIIMDGNARWAKKNNLNIFNGHKKGVHNIKEIALACIEFNIKYLTIYAFSSENWQRSKTEVNNLLKLLDEYLDNGLDPLHENGIRINIFGDLSKIPKNLLDKINQSEEKTKNNKSLILNVAFSYGARQEIVEAAKKVAFAVKEGQINISQVDEELFSKNLYNINLPDPDLLIRTAGDLRVSNFLLWQIAYSELYFVKDFWPDFNKEKLLQAINDFNNRDRRYGKR